MWILGGTRLLRALTLLSHLLHILLAWWSSKGKYLLHLLIRYSGGAMVPSGVKAVLRSLEVGSRSSFNVFWRALIDW